MIHHETKNTRKEEIRYASIFTAPEKKIAEDVNGWLLKTENEHKRNKENYTERNQ